MKVKEVLKRLEAKGARIDPQETDNLLKMYQQFLLKYNKTLGNLVKEGLEEQRDLDRALQQNVILGSRRKKVLSNIGRRQVRAIQEVKDTSDTLLQEFFRLSAKSKDWY